MSARQRHPHAVNMTDLIAKYNEMLRRKAFSSSSSTTITATTPLSLLTTNTTRSTATFNASQTTTTTITKLAETVEIADVASKSRAIGADGLVRFVVCSNDTRVNERVNSRSPWDTEANEERIQALEFTAIAWKLAFVTLALVVAAFVVCFACRCLLIALK